MFKKGFSVVALVVAVVVIVGGVLVWQLWPESQSSAEEAVKNVVTKFLQAEQARNFENAKPFLSSEFAKTIDPITFAGTSNPHMSLFEIEKVQLLPDGKTYLVNAKVYQEYTGEGNIGYNDNSYYVKLLGDTYLINDIKYGRYIELPKNETADWNIFSNKEYGYEFKYPKNWYKLDTSIAESKGIYIARISTNPSGEWSGEEMGKFGSLEIYRQDNQKNLAVENWYGSLPTEDRAPYKYITVDGIKSIEADGGMELSGKIAFIPHENWIYQISMQIMGSSGEKQELENIFTQILSTFKFTKVETNSLTLNQLKNTEYKLNDKIYLLKNGQYSGKIMQGKADAAGSVNEIIELQEDKTAFGDLNGDGKEDAIIISFYNVGGGSGNYLTLNVFLNKDGPLFSASEDLGDRVIINSLSIKDGIITVDMLTHGPTDGMCCPTLKQIRRFKLSGNLLEEIF